MTGNYTIELQEGEQIEGIKRVSIADDGMLNLHSAGSGHRVVEPERLSDKDQWIINLLE